MSKAEPCFSAKDLTALVVRIEHVKYTIRFHKRAIGLAYEELRGLENTFAATAAKIEAALNAGASAPPDPPA